jgi:FKBP-type peptidyl-prolyl cis-trans isomerase
MLVQKLLLACVLAALVAVSGCTGSAENVQRAQLGQRAEQAPVEPDNGLIIEEILVGTGRSPQQGQNVAVHYTGWLTDGTKFDSSVDRGEPFVFPVGVGRVIKGWDQGVMTMRVGGKRKLTVPPELGYGDRGAGTQIPPGATLVFEVELLEVR